MLGNRQLENAFVWVVWFETAKGKLGPFYVGASDPIDAVLGAEVKAKRVAPDIRFSAIHRMFGGAEVVGYYPDYEHTIEQYRLWRVVFVERGLCKPLGPVFAQTRDFEIAINMANNKLSKPGRRGWSYDYSPLDLVLLEARELIDGETIF